MPSERTYTPEAHVCAARFAAKAAHALALATMMSTPCEFRGDAAGRKTSGVASVIFAEGGNAITLDKDTFESAETALVHGSVTLCGAPIAADCEHVPAVAAVVPVTEAQRHEVQPGVSNAEDAQQQPPRHRFVPQSAFDAHVSPGLKSTQEPV